MLYLIDSANLLEIDRLTSCYPIAGVTTNPTIIAAERKPISGQLKAIRDIIGPDAMLHAQVLSSYWRDMLEEAAKLKELVGGNFYVKVPVTCNGIKAIAELKRQGYQITATAIFTPQQAMVAARAGADYVAPYVNRLDNISSDGGNVASEIVAAFRQYGLNSKVIAASFKNIEQIHKACQAGVDAATIPPELFEYLIYHPLTDKSVEDFIVHGKEYYDL